MALSRDDILGAPDLEPVALEVREWGGEVFLRRFTAGEALEFEDANGLDLLVASVVDGDGQALFKPADIERLEKKSAVAVNRVLQMVLRLNGLGASEGN